MATYPIQIPQLGVQFTLTEDWTPSDEDIWDAVKLKIPPQDMFSAYHRGEKEFVRNAYRNGYFKGAGLGKGLTAIWDLGWDGVSEVGTGIAASKKADFYRYNYKPFDMISATGKLKPHEGMFTFENEKGEVRDLRDHAESLKKGGVYLQGLLEAAPVGKWDAEGLMKEAIVHSGMGWWPNQKDVRRWITTYMTDHDEAQASATIYKGAGNIIYGYPMMGQMAGAWFSQAWLDDDEQIDNWIETYEKVNKLEEGRQRSARQVAMQVGDMETFRKLRAEEVEPREGAALLAEIFFDPANVAGGLVAKGVTAPVRASLTGATKRTLLGLQDDLIKQGALKGDLIKQAALPSGEVSARKTATEAALAEVNKSIAAREKILARYSGQGFVGRLTGSPVSALAAEEALDLTTEAGQKASTMAREALSPRAPKTLTSRVVGGVSVPYWPGKSLNVGAMPFIGGTMEVAGRVLLYMKAIPENAALKLIQKVSAKELTEQEAKSILAKLAVLTGAGYTALEEGDIMDEVLVGLSGYLGPRVLATVGRDMRVIGGELALAQTTDPFFRRLGALPTPAEGLAGAAVDRTNVLTQGFWSATKAAATDPAKLSIRGKGVGVTPYLSGVPKGVARFLDTKGADVGRFLEGGGRFGGAMAEGMALPAGIGYVGSGGEPAGAVVGAAISAPFTFIGAGLGKLANFGNKGDLARKQLGDVEYFRDHLTPKEKKEFDAMSVGERMVRASVALSMPDLMLEGQSLGKRGGPGHHRVGEDGSVVVYNKDTETPIGVAVTHEGGHHMEVHGLTELTNRIMFGDPDLGTAGVYVKRTKDGKPVYLRDADGEFILHPVTKRKQWELSDDFRKLKEDYMERLRRTSGVSAEEYKSYRDSPEKIGREIFAERYSALKRSGELQRHIDRGPIGRLLATVAKVIFPESFTKSLMLKLGVPIDKDGKVVRTGIFKNLQRIPEIDAIIKKYAKDTAGKTKAEIESAFPISEEFKQSFSIEDQRDPTVRGLMNTGGVFKTNPDGSLALDSMGNPKRMTKGQLDKLDEAASAHALGVLERHGVEIKTSTGKDGVEKKSATFKNLTEEMIDELDAGPFHSRQIEALRKIAAALRDGDGQEAGFLLGYFAASKSGRPQPLPYRIRKAFPYEFELTQGGNILVKLIDPAQLEKNLKFLQKDPRFLKWSRLFKNDNEVWDDIRTYTANQVAGRDGWAAGLGKDKANFLNALLGGLTQEQVELNPILQMLGWKKASAKGSRAPFGPSLKSFRLDRVFKAERTGEGMLFDYTRAKRLMMPAESLARKEFKELGFSVPRFQEWITKDGERVPEMAKKVGDTYEPIIFYHGGDIGRDAPSAGSRRIHADEEYKPLSDVEGRWTFEPGQPVWLARDPWFAKRFGPEGRQPLALVTRVERVFNAANPEHRRLFEKSRSEWEVDPTLSYKSGHDTTVLKELGFDAYWETQYRGGNPEAYAKRLAEDPHFFKEETQLVVLDGSDLKLASDHEIPVSGEFTGDRLFMPAERSLGLRDNIQDDVLPSIKQAKLSPQQLQAALAKTAGAKSYADEIGLTEFVKGRKSITKDEVEAYVRENSPKLEVEVRQGAVIDDQGFHVIGRLPIDELNPTKFSGPEWNEPGGTNHREVIVRLPRKKGEPVFKDDQHFGDNVLLWLRLNDRIGADGKRVVFIEELQSQLHQEGRKEGYGKGGYAAEYPISVENEAVRGGMSKEQAKADIEHLMDEPVHTEERSTNEQWERLNRATWNAEGIDLDEVFHNFRVIARPDAPFKKNWPALGLKLAIKEALEGGYDRVAWLDGDGQAARYDLSKHVDRIDYFKNRDGTYDIYPVKEESIVTGHKLEGLSKDKIVDLVGKDIADKIIKGEGIPRPKVAKSERQLTALQGNDLKVGGEGMKAFYDREMRSVASKISKKIKGGKVEKDFGILRSEKGAVEPPHVAHAFDLPKDPAAADNLRLYMPAERAPSDSRPPEIIREIGRKRHETVPLPFIDDIGDKTPGEGFRRVVTAKKTKAEMEEFLRPEPVEGKNVSQVQEFQPRFPKGERHFMPAESKGRPERILLRTSPEVKAYAKQLAKERGISMNDALNIALENALPSRKGRAPEGVEGDITLRLTPEEEKVLAKTEIGPEDAELYRRAVAKQREIAHRDLGAKLFMPAAYHGTPHTFKAEEGAPLGRFRSSQIGTGEGAQAYGHGLYFAGKKEVAEHYRKTIGINDENIGARIKVDGKEMPTKFAELAKVIKDPIERDAIHSLQRHNGDFDSALNFYKLDKSAEAKSKKAINDLRGRVELIEKRGSLYKVELAPKENEYLYWDKPLSEQPKGVREKLGKMPDKSPFAKGDKGVVSKIRRREGDVLASDFYRVLESTLFDESLGSGPAASAALLEAGIPGIKYLEGASRAKGKGDYNYVIFDEGAVTITEKLFMPAEEAGAPKGKQAEAARLWEKKGTDSPYFKKWFGKSKVVDEEGNPLVVYHGMPSKLKGSFFDPKKTGEGHDVEGPGFYFTNERQEAAGYMRGEKGSVYDVYLKLENPIDGNTRMPSRKTLETLIAKAHKSKSIDDMQNKFDADLDLFWESPLSNWSESPHAAVEAQINAILNYGSAHDAFQTVWYDVFGANNEAYMKAMTEIGIDGVVLKSETRHAGNDHYIVFSPEQIKSATGNRGTFDAGESNILYMPAGQPATPAPRRAARPAPQGNRFMAPAAKRVAEEAELEKFLR